MKAVTERLGHSTRVIGADLCTDVHDDVARDAATRMAGMLMSRPAADVSELLAHDPRPEAS